MARPRDPELRGRLLAAATEEFVENGYAGASMAGVGARAGVTKGGVYFHFRTKEELFFAALDHWHGELREALARGAWQSSSKPPGGAADLEVFVREYLRLHFESPHGSRLLRVLSAELSGAFTSRLREDERQEHRWLRAQIRELLTRGGREGALFAEDPAMSAFVLAASIEGALAQWVAAPRDVEPFCDPGHLAAVLVAPFRSASTPRRAEDEDRLAPGT